MKDQINKQQAVAIFGILLVCSFALFLKGFFPVKQGLKGYSKKEEAPNIPGLNDNKIPPGKYDRLVILVIDALRKDFVFQTHYQMPYVHELLSNKHGIGFIAKVHPPTVTLPRIKALTTGGIPGFVDVVLNFGSSSLDEDNLITQLHNNNKNIVFYGDDTWLKLFPDHFLRTDGTTSFFVTDYTEVDTNVSRHLPDELIRYDWDVMILHYLGLDHIGHLAGPLSPLVPPKLLEMDSVIYKIFQAMKLWIRETEQESLLMVCGDHGMSDQGGHGGASPGETTVPVIFISPSLSLSGSTVAHHESIMQIDVVPTLSSLLGIPIPKNNLGKIVTEALIGYNEEDKVRLMQLNCHQVATLLKHNVADVEKEEGYRLYQQTMKRHSDWLQERNSTQELWEHVGQRLMKDYGKAVHEMRSRVSETSTTYDLYTMGLGILLLWLILFFLLCLSKTDTQPFHLTPNRITLSIICCIPFVLGHMTICTSQLHSEFLCTTNIFLVLLQVIVLFVVVLATLFSIMSFRYQKKIQQQSVYNCHIAHIFVGGLVLHTFSLLSSSFVEEEHQTWYFFISTIHIILICNLIGCVCSATVETDEGDQSRYTLKNNYVVDQTVTPDLFNQRKQNIKTFLSSCQGEGSKHYVLGSVAAILSVLVLCRILRRWNQTGDKWLIVPDVGDWLVRPEHKKFLSVTMAVSMLCVCVTRWRSSSLLQSALFVLSMASTYCFRAANGAVAFSSLYSGTSKGLLEARCSYAFITLQCISGLREWWTKRDQPNYKSQELWENIQLLWIMIMMLLLRPHNSALVAMVTLIENLVSNQILPVIQLQPVFLTMYCVWWGQATFFFQGNSNSLTTVDVSAGYVGLDNYLPVLIGLLMWASTNAGPVFWMISLMKYLQAENIQKTNRTPLRLAEDHMTSAITLLMCQALPLAVYSVLVTVERYHLFVWTVFSPKLLYEGNLLLVTCVFVYLNLFCAVHYGNSRKKHLK